jgi:hypothetical protein
MGEWRYTSALDGGEWSASCPCNFTPGERVPGTQWLGGWVDPRVGLDAVEKIKILHWWESNLGCLARSPSLYRLLYAARLNIKWERSTDRWPFSRIFSTRGGVPWRVSMNPAQQLRPSTIRLMNDSRWWMKDHSPRSAIWEPHLWWEWGSLNTTLLSCQLVQNKKEASQWTNDWHTDTYKQLTVTPHVHTVSQCQIKSPNVSVSTNTTNHSRIF